MRPFGPFPDGRSLHRMLDSFRRLAIASLAFAIPLALAASAQAEERLSLDGGDLAFRTCDPGASGCFLDADGRYRREDSLYRAMFDGRDPKYLRTAVELTALVGIGTAWYWFEKDKNALDWDLDSIRMRFRAEAYRYDNNPFPMNFIWHAMSGSFYYAFARANDLDVFASFASGFLASWLWEFVMEFRERVSINDQIVTPGAGVVFGEFIYKLGRYFGSSPGGGRAKHKALRWTVGLPVALHDAMDGRTPPPPGSRADERGFHPDIAARFRLSYGPGLASATTGPDFVIHEVDFEGTLVSLPGYLRPGHFQRFFADANLTSLRLRTRIGGSGSGRGMEMSGETVLLGLHHQAIDEGGSGGAWGGAATIGTSVTYLYRREHFDHFDDELAPFGFPGLHLDTHTYLGRASLHLGARAHGEFAGVHSGAYPAWEDDHPMGRAKTILRKQGYYYGWGGSARFLAELRMPWLVFGGSIRTGVWNSDEGLDRTQNQVKDDVRGRDRALDMEGYLRLLPFDGPLFVEASHRVQRRRSEMEGYDARWALSSSHVRLGMQW